jgi:TolA-binding protein
VIQLVYRQFFILLVIVIVVPPLLLSQITSSSVNDDFFLDLGIVIEPSNGDEEINRLIQAPPEKVKLFIDKAPSGSVYMASTKELQETLVRINHKIEGLQLAFQRQTENLEKENGELRVMINNLIEQVESPVKELAVIIEESDEVKNSPVEKVNEELAVIAKHENPPVFNRTLYMNAVFAYQREDYQTAIRQFSDLALDDIDDITAGNVLYWMADCYFQLDQPSNALSVLKQLGMYKESDKLDDSMILQGLAFRQLGEKDKAVAAFAGVVELYPESEYYRLAQMEFNRSLK